MEADTGVLAATQKLVRSAKLASQRPQRGFYLKRLDQWQANEYWRQARQIRARAIAEDRSLNQWEEQQVPALHQGGLRATVGSMLLDVIKRFEGGVRTPLPGLAGNQIAEDPSLLEASPHHA